MWTKVRLFADKRGRRAAIALLVVLAVGFVVLSLLMRRNLDWLSDPVALRTWIRSFGVLAPLAFLGLQAIQVVVAPVPGHVLGFVSGCLFGAYWGTVISVSGAVVGSYVAFALSRRFGRPFVERVIHPEALDQFDRLTHDHGLLALFLVFLVPGLPDDVICFTAGLTDLRIDRMVLVSLVGRIPGFFLLNVAGANVANGNLWVTVVIVSGLAVVTGVVYAYRRQVLAYLELDVSTPE